MARLRIVLSGYYGFDNVGDEAILYAIIQSLRAYQPKVEITVLSNKPEKTADTYGVDAVNRWSLLEVTRALKSADGLISGGGSLLQDETGRKSIAYYAGVMKIAQLLRKPVFVYAQGIGPINLRANQLIVKNTLQSANLLTVRDTASKILLEEIGVKAPIGLVPDPVMGMDPSGFQSDWLAAQSFTGPVVTVSIRDWTEELSYLDEIASALDKLAERGRNIVLVPMHGKHDLSTSERVKGMMANDATIFPHDSSIEQKMAVIKDSDVLLGMRLHALIFAAVGYTPFAAISYDPKIDSFSAIVDQQVVGSIKERDVFADTIVEAIERILSNPSCHIDNLKKFVEPLHESAGATAKAVIDALGKAPDGSQKPITYAEKAKLRNR
ncbi:polysaccharide pyruvyl transferase CsaB [Planococcus koreensis]|uniref:polysaccharide pyruvyl transferase CsaB n=1 Tax=Planococcus koreensis TaxID=112331 RepID=UPI0030C7E48E